jgi:hypothetical protein
LDFIPRKVMVSFPHIMLRLFLPLAQLRLCFDHSILVIIKS